MIIDTHCHLHFEQFDEDRDAVIGRAQEAGVGRFIDVGTDPDNNQKAFALASQYPFMRHTAGLHPHSAHEADASVLKRIERHVAETKPCAIGEIGLDYFKSEASPDVQKAVFRKMLRIAKEHGLPVIVHSRDAFDDTYAILKDEVGSTGRSSLRGVMHCYSYDVEALKKLIDIGFLASFTCNLTYKNPGGFLDAAVWAPLDHIMLETDSPYLSPQTHRGQRNEPSHLAELALFLAARRGIPKEELVRATSANAVKFFGLSS